MESESQQAFLLHRKPFRENSAICEFLTLEQGRVPAVARTVAGSGKKTRQWAAALQCFQQLDITLKGRGELKTLLDIEENQRYPLQGKALFSAMYLNEITLRLLHRYDPHPELFQAYQYSLEQLASGRSLEPVLRHYELGLLQQLGYGLELARDAETGAAFLADAWYRLDTERGLVREYGVTPSARLRFSGVELLALQANPDSSESLKTLKRICRVALESHLGGKPLQSRALFSAREQ